MRGCSAEVNLLTAGEDTAAPRGLSGIRGPLRKNMTAPLKSGGRVPECSRKSRRKLEGKTANRFSHDGYYTGIDTFLFKNGA